MTQKIDLPINEALSEILNQLDPEEYRKVLLVIDDCNKKEFSIYVDLFLLYI